MRWLSCVPRFGDGDCRADPADPAVTMDFHRLPGGRVPLWRTAGGGLCIGGCFNLAACMVRIAWECTAMDADEDSH